MLYALHMIYPWKSHYTDDWTPQQATSPIPVEGEEADFQNYHIAMFKISSSQQKIYMAYKATEKYGVFTGGKKQLAINISEETKTLDLLDEDFSWIKCAQEAERNHAQGTKGNQGNNA